NPNATRTKVNTGATVIRLLRLAHQMLKQYAMPISVAMLNPSQYALKLPATKPDRILSDAPPSREELTTSFTCDDSVEVNTFTSSGMMAPASVPHVMTVDSFHHSVPSPRVGISRYDTT